MERDFLASGKIFHIFNIGFLSEIIHQTDRNFREFHFLQK